MPLEDKPDAVTAGKQSPEPVSEDSSANREPSAEPSTPEFEDISESAASVNLSEQSICAKCGGTKVKSDGDLVTLPRRKSAGDIDILPQRKSDSDPDTLGKGNSDGDLNVLKALPICNCDLKQDGTTKSAYLEKEAGATKTGHVEATGTQVKSCESSDGKSSEEALYGDSVGNTSNSVTPESSATNLDSEAGASGVSLTTKRKSQILSDDSAMERYTSDSCEDSSSDSGISDPPPPDNTMVIMTCVMPGPGSRAAPGRVPPENLQESPRVDAPAAAVVQIEDANNENGHTPEPRVTLHGLDLESNDGNDSRNQTTVADFKSTLKVIATAVALVCIIIAIFVASAELSRNRKGGNNSTRDMDGNSTSG